MRPPIRLFRAGVRFYQLNRATPAGAFTIGEQQTWAPADTENRWMGSAATNFQNDVAVGFSTSSATVFPSVRYAARLGTDTPGTGLAQGETSIVAGGGSQTSTSGRWGDYSDLTVDPSDDCTFWYTQEYYVTSTEPGNTTAPGTRASRSLRRVRVRFRRAARLTERLPIAKPVCRYPMPL